MNNGCDCGRCPACAAPPDGPDERGSREAEYNASVERQIEESHRANVALREGLDELRSVRYRVRTLRLSLRGEAFALSDAQLFGERFHYVTDITQGLARVEDAISELLIKVNRG